MTNDKHYKEMAKRFPLVVPVHSSTQLQNMVIDKEHSQAYLSAETEQDYAQLQGKLKAELLAKGFSETEASKHLSSMKPLIRSQKPIPNDLELKTLDISGSIPTPRTPEQQEQTRNACYQLYAQVYGMPVGRVKQYFEVLRDVLNEQK
jgi:hypothetical protein